MSADSQASTTTHASVYAIHRHLGQRWLLGEVLSAIVATLDRRTVVPDTPHLSPDPWAWWPLSLSPLAAALLIGALALVLWRWRGSQIGERSESEAEAGGIALPWLEMPGWLLLSFVLLAAPAGLVAGPNWPALAGGAVVVAWAGALAWGARGLGGLRLEGSARGDLLRVDTVAGLGAVALVWLYLRNGVNDDPFCHHVFVALIERSGLPLSAPGGSGLPVAYHVGFDAVAAALAQVPGLPGAVEWRLDLVSLWTLLALLGAALSFSRRFAVPDGVRALAVVGLLLGGGVGWLGWWLPDLLASTDPSARFEGATWLSALHLAGRRATLLGWLCGVLFLRLVRDGALGGTGARGRRPGLGVGLLLAILMGAASQCAEEALLWMVLGVAAVALHVDPGTHEAGLLARIGAGVRRFRHPLLVLLAAAPLALLAGGYVSVRLGLTLGLLDAHHLPLEPPGGLVWPAWPSFMGPSPAFPGPGWWRTLLLELAPAVLVPPLLWRGPERGQPWLRVVVVWWGLGLVLAQVLLVGSPEYRGDLHRLMHMGVGLGWLLWPIWLWQASPWRGGRRLALLALACGPLWVSAVARVTMATGATLPLLSAALAANMLLLGTAPLSRRVRPLLGLLLGALVVSIVHLALERERMRPPPPPLPDDMVAWLAGRPQPLLAGPDLSHLLLLHGHDVWAPSLRFDLEELKAPVHLEDLRTVDAARLREAGVRGFVLPAPLWRELRARLPLVAEGRAPAGRGARPWAIWSTMRFAASEQTVWVWGRLAAGSGAQSAAAGRDTSTVPEAAM